MYKQSELEKYAHLLVNYCLELQPGERVFVKSTTLAEPLVREVYKAATIAGAYAEVELEFEGRAEIFYEFANDDLLKMHPTLYTTTVKRYDAYLLIRAPFDLLAAAKHDPSKKSLRRESLKEIQQTYFERTGTGSLKRTLCEYPTEAAAKMAGLSLEAYAEFIYEACLLNNPNPQAKWIEIRHKQQKLVDYLNNKSTIRYKNNESDIEFKTDARIWINSDGRNNMPSGEVYTGPVEQSVNGTVFFDFPSVFQGKRVEGIRLWVKEGMIEKWEAKEGQELLDQIFKVDGARRFGEAAIGTNYNINKSTRNILFDEKIGGTIHMAVGQSYAQTGAKNKSSIHWDMIADMRNGGQIYADDELIYQDGEFLI